MYEIILSLSYVFYHVLVVSTLPPWLSLSSPNAWLDLTTRWITALVGQGFFGFRFFVLLVFLCGLLDLFTTSFDGWTD